MTFELKKGGLRATAQTKGGELVSLRDSGGLEYLWDAPRETGRGRTRSSSLLWGR